MSDRRFPFRVMVRVLPGRGWGQPAGGVWRCPGCRGAATWHQYGLAVSDARRHAQTCRALAVVNRAPYEWAVKA